MLDPLPVPIFHYILFGTALFVIGGIGFLTRRNILVVFMSLELMLNAVNIIFIAFARQMQDLTGQIFAMFVITVAAAEAAVGLAILIVIYRNRHTVNADDVSELKW